MFKLTHLSIISLVSQLAPVCGLIFDQVTQPYVWLTVSSLVSRGDKWINFRQIELNWINVPRDPSNSDYLALYLDGEPESGQILPVSVYRLNNKLSGRLTSDFYLPQIDFYAETNEFASKYPSEFDKIIQNNNHSNGHKLSLKRSLNRECIGYCLAYHSNGTIVAKNCLNSNPNWMLEASEQLSSRSLPWIMIPGTHNSGTYARQLDASAFGMLNKYQMNQDENIFSQLVYGIRHLDLRVGYSKVKHRHERLWIYHDIFRTDVSAEQVFEQVRRFLDLTSQEMIVMDFHRFTVGFDNENLDVQRERHAKLIELIQQHLGKYIVPSYMGIGTPIGELVALGKRLVVGYAATNWPSIMASSSLSSNLNKHELYDHSGFQKATIDTTLREPEAQHHNQDSYSSQWAQNRNSSDILMIDRHLSSNSNEPQQTMDHRMGTRIFNKLKLLNIVRKSFSKRSLAEQPFASGATKAGLAQAEPSTQTQTELASSLAKAALFFKPVRHLWPNKDTLEGLAAYMNDTTCKRHFGELRSMMVELTPTVFGVLSDKYDGNRKLAHIVNRPVGDWIRDRWLHCVNIVASDYFLGNDLIRLSIYANRMRAGHQNGQQPVIDMNSLGECQSFRKIGHLLDKTKIPIQLVYDFVGSSSNPNSNSKPTGDGDNHNHNDKGDDSDKDQDMIAYRRPSNESSSLKSTVIHTNSDGSRVHLRLLTNQSHNSLDTNFYRRETFVENIADGLANMLNSLKMRFFGA